MPSTARVSISSTTFTDLGVAPVQVQCLGPGPVTIVVADSLPSVGTLGYVLQFNDNVLFHPADASSHVYAALFNNPVTVAYNIASS